MTDHTITTPAGKRHPDSKLRRMRPVGATVPPEPLPSAMLRSSVIEQWRPHFERAIGGALLGLSIAGTVALFNGSWGMPRLAPFAWGLLVQALLTLTQWLYRRERLSWQYGSALLIDAGLSVGGFAQVGWVPLLAVISRAGWPETINQVLACALLVVFAGFLAYIPERILVTD